jgi:hypothetical protein
MHHLILQEPGSGTVLNRIVEFVDGVAGAASPAARDQPRSRL